MGVICLTNDLIILCIKDDIWWRLLDKSEFSKVSLQHNLNNPSATVKQAIISRDNSLLAILTTTKRILLFKLPDFHFMRSMELPRAGSKVTFLDDSQLVVADKTGDVLLYSIKDNRNEGDQVLGHLSLLTDVLISDDNKYIITSDRDEKIRISNYPKTYNIESFCLGHKEFITSLHFLPHNNQYLISTSGDGCIKIWDYVIGKEILSTNVNKFFNDEKEIISFQNAMKEDDIIVECLPICLTSCCVKDASSSLIAVSLFSSNNIFVFEISNKSDSPQMELLDKISCNNTLLDVKLTLDRLWVLCVGDSVQLDQWCLSGSKYTLGSSENIKPLDSPEHDEMLACKNELTFLYKRRFDNVQEYKNRKKQRLGID